MFPARRIAGARTALLPIAAAIVAFSPTVAQAKDSPAACEEAAQLGVLVSPYGPWKGAPLRVVVSAEKPLKGELSLIAPDGSVAAKSHQWEGGPPYFAVVEVASPAVGTWHARLVHDGAAGECATITRDIAVRETRSAPPHGAPGTAWAVRNTWNRANENLYSAWVQKLFDAPLDAEPSYKALHEVLRDKARNVLFNYLGLNEDSSGMIVRPDCADFPYFLRAYFAFKMGLPFGYSNCTRGTHGTAPRCVAWTSILRPKAATPAVTPVAATPGAPVAPPKPAAPRGPVQAFGAYLRTVADTVHSGTARTLGKDDNTDLYPVPLSVDALRPGTVYADPYGHTLVIVKRIAQLDGKAGVLLAFDAQPDGTVARKRFWRGNFLFAKDPALGGPGFKHFRPIVREKNGTLRRLTNAEIAKNPQYADFSLEQAKLDTEAFYDKMDDVLSPTPLDPMGAMKEAITALEEQVKARVTSVENGRKYQLKSPGTVNMPDGATIFETTGAWEDFSTPSRDLRLLIAIDVVRTFPDRVARRPERYAMPAGTNVAAVTAEMKQVLAAELAARKFSYVRSDGSQWPLTLHDVLERLPLLEMAYNPNDCVELRWGAAAQSKEAATCKRHAPEAQRLKMAKYRPWFHERRRPPRP